MKISIFLFFVTAEHFAYICYIFVDADPGTFCRITIIQYHTDVYG